MNYGLKYVSVKILIVLILISLVFLKGNVGQFTVLGILVAWSAYNLFVYFRPRWAVKQQSGTKSSAHAKRPPQKPVVPSAAHAATSVPPSSAPVAQGIPTPAPRMVAMETQSEYKQVMLRHINFRITQKLQGAFPGATWSWCCNNPADIAVQGGTARIRTFATGDNNFAEVAFEQSGCIKLSMLQLRELDEVKKPAPAAEAKSTDPDAVDLFEWYDLSASSVVRATIDEVYTRGYKSLYIGESGEVYVKEDDQNVKQGKLNFMPGKKLWNDLIPCFADDDILAAVGDDEITLTWA